MIKYKRKVIVFFALFMIVPVIALIFISKNQTHQNNFNMSKLEKTLDQLEEKNNALEQVLKKSKVMRKSLAKYAIKKNNLKIISDKIISLVNLTAVLNAKGYNIILDTKYINKAEIIIVFKMDEFLNQKIAKRIFDKIVKYYFNSKPFMIKTQMAKTKYTIEIIKTSQGNK